MVPALSGWWAREPVCVSGFSRLPGMPLYRLVIRGFKPGHPFYCLQETPGEPVKIQILDQQVWVGAEVGISNKPQV